MSRYAQLKAFVFLSFVLFAGAVTAAKYQPINEIPGQVPETDEEEGIWELGRAHQEKSRNNGDALIDESMEVYLEGIVTRLLGDMALDIGLEVDVLVFKDPIVNAWVYPDGTVAVQTGLLAAVENEAQLAAIFGHELSHFLNRHAFIQIKSKQKQSAIGKGLGLLAMAGVAAKTGAIDTSLMSTGQLWTELVTNGYSRKLETAADKQGLALLAAAGYPPKEALLAFETLRIKDDDQVNIAKMWSSHPDIDSRLKNLSKQIKKLKPHTVTEPLSGKAFLSQIGKAIMVNSQLLSQRLQYRKAIADLENYASMVPDDAAAMFLLGEAYRKDNPEGHYDARLRVYTQALTLDSSLHEAHREIGMAYRQQGQSLKAAEAFKQYLLYTPNAPDAPIVRWYMENL